MRDETAWFFIHSHLQMLAIRSVKLSGWRGAKELPTSYPADVHRAGRVWGVRVECAVGGYVPILLRANVNTTTTVLYS